MSREISKSDIVERLRLLIGNKSQKEFADELQVSPAKIAEYLSRKTRPGIDFLFRLALKGVNLKWFVTGKGPVFQQEEKTETPEEIQLVLREIETSYPTADRAEIKKILTESYRFIKEEKVTPEEVMKTLRLLAHIGRLQVERKKGQK